MALMKRTRSELDMPDWFPARRLLDWPTAWRDLMEDTLRVEEYQDGHELVIRAEMPGIDPDEDVEITVSDHMLHITAERREEKKTEDHTGYRSEFRYGSFSRSVSLPTGATDDDVKATYNDGILEVRVPIDTAEAKARKIPVNRA